MLEKLGVKNGMAVFDVAGRPVGSVDSISGDDFTAGGKDYSVNHINMVEPSGIYLSVS
ncbi:hypothetical protein [Croceicoccus bisphenolivorans]|uniref:hypothetical protein n=1 Tax=Croceicoccus bisphenolivorans TaxID=1783232 RepID=UPI000AE0FCC5|nr:hypothetical protein [Croceicoccus bisphenolivorans]